MSSKPEVASIDIRENGRSLVQHEEDGIIHIEGSQGVPFEILISNRSTERRFIAIISVDGLCVIDCLDMGDSDGLGYIVEPRQTVTVSEWRYLDSNRHRLKFDTLPDEDAMYPRLDKPTQIGTILIKIFLEQLEPVYSGDFLSQSGYLTRRVRSSGWGSVGGSDSVIRSQFAKEETVVAEYLFQYK